MMNSHDPFGVWNGEKFQFTLKKLCDIIFNGREYTMPKAFVPIQDKIIDRVTADTMLVTKGLRVVFDLSWNVPREESSKKILGYLKSGVIVVTNRSFTDAKDKKYPVIRIRNTWEAWINLGKYVKGVFPIPTIGLTGSAGKTTSTMFAYCVFNERYNTFISGLNGSNYNTTLSIVDQWIQRANPEYTFHVQECGGETIDLIKSSASVLNVDGFGITNIDTTQHIATYKKAENLIADKTSFDRVRKDDTFGVINLDDEILKSFEFKSPIITFAINDESADYIGKNIIQNNELLEFDIVSKDETVHIRIHIIGKHNVYNALMVFAFAKKFGLTNEEIQNGFWKYESVGIRQYLRRVGGKLLYMDAYNASVESVQLSLKAMEELSLPTGAKRIAIIGERKTSNEETLSINNDLGRKLADFKKIDEFIIIGDPIKAEKPEYQHALYDGAKEVITDEAKLSFYTDLKAVAEKLRCQIFPGDAVLFKGRHQLALWNIADFAFGTSYFSPPIGKNILVTNKMWRGRYYPLFGGVNIFRVIDEGATKLLVPNVIRNKPVVRIGDGLFVNNSQLNMIVFGFNLRSIGNSSFKNCSNLEQIELPKSCMYVGNSAFEDCAKLAHASMPGVAHISKSAFKNCTDLKQILLTEKCATIEDEAFENCTKLTVCAPENSYAQKWAEENGFKFEAIDSDDELEKLAKNGTRLNPNIYALERFENEEEITDNKIDGKDEKVANLSVVTAGDIVIQAGHIISFFDKSTGTYVFDKLFANTKKHFKSADLSIANVEAVFGRGLPKGATRFNTPDELAYSLANAGIDIAASANNHIFDMKYAGIVRTRHILQSYGIDVAGIRSTENEKAYVIVERKGVKIALINFTYRTQSKNGIKTINNYLLDSKSEKLINTFCFETLDYDLINVKREIQSAKEDGADIVLVYYHWGGVYEVQSNTLQKYIAYKTAEMGADAILGSHAHVLQEISKVTVCVNGEQKDVPVFYSLGNYSWAARLPRTGRETVHNGALAKLDIEYDKELKKIVSIKTNYVPLYIKTDYIYDKFDFNTLSLHDMDEEETAVFNRRNCYTVSQIIEQIEKALYSENSKDSAEYKFDNVVEIPVGKCVSLSDVLTDEEFVSLTSENAPVASVLQSLKIVGNSFGFTGITAERADGSKVYFVVKVVGNKQSDIPVLVDEYNFVPDIYHPKKLVSGIKYGLSPSIYLEKKTAEAWHVMKLYASYDGVYMFCSSGYRSKETQLRKIVITAEKADSETIENQFVPIGCTVHHLGTVLDVANIQSKGSSFEKISEWLEENAWKYGFVIKQSDSEKHKPIWYAGRPSVAKLLQEEQVSMASFIENYDEYNARAVEDACEWKNDFLSEDEIDAPIEEWDKLTLKRICDIIEIDVPVVYKDIQNRVIPSVTLSDLSTEPGCAFVYDKMLKNSVVKTRNAFRNGAAIAITDTILRDENGKLLTQLKVKDSIAACIKISQYFRQKSEAKVIAIAENNKQILRDILFEMLSPEYSILKNETTVDNRINTFNLIQELKPEHQIYLQNIHHVLPGYMRKNAEMLLPNIAVASKLKVKYPAIYKSFDAYKKDRCSVIDVTLENGGTVFIDIDEPIYEAYIGMPNVVTFSGSKNENADYYICETVQEENSSEITLKYSKNGAEFEKKISTKYAKSLDYVIAAIAVADSLK